MLGDTLGSLDHLYVSCSSFPVGLYAKRFDVELVFDSEFVYRRFSFWNNDECCEWPRMRNAR